MGIFLNILRNVKHFLEIFYKYLDTTVWNVVSLIASLVSLFRFILVCVFFFAFVLNTERCSVSHLIQCDCRKMRTRIIPYTDTFYAVSVSVLISFLCFPFNWTRTNSLIFGTFWNFMNEVSSLTTEWVWWKFDFHTIGRPLDLTDAFAQISYQERRFI